MSHYKYGERSGLMDLEQRGMNPSGVSRSLTRRRAKSVCTSAMCGDTQRVCVYTSSMCGARCGSGDMSYIVTGMNLSRYSAYLCKKWASLGDNWRWTINDTVWHRGIWRSHVRDSDSLLQIWGNPGHFTMTFRGAPLSDLRPLFFLGYTA
jgi:hypothetical protein